MTENVVGNFYLNWTFLTFYFITLDLRKRYSEHRDNNQNIFEIINHDNTDFKTEIIAMSIFYIES